MQKEQGLDKTENSIVKSVIQLKDKTVRDLYTKLENQDDCYMLDLQTRVDRNLLENLYERGYSRIPVFDHHRKEIKGILMSKDLILMNPDKDNPTVEQISSILRDAAEISVDTNAMDALTFFLDNQGHMVVVYEKKTITDDKGGKKEIRDPVGIITLEDIIEALTGKEIEDEMENDTELNIEQLQKINL